MSRARKATPPISAGQSVGPARADAYIAAAQPSQPRRNVPGSIRRFGRRPPYRSPTPPATGCSRKRPPRACGFRVEKRGPQCFPPRPRCLMSVVGRSRPYCHVRSLVRYPQRGDITTSDRDPSACRVPTPDLQTTGTAAAAPESWLRSIWRHVMHVRSPKIRHIDCNEPARNLLPGCFVWSLSVRSWRRIA
jgi:hypothetical protein